MDDIVAIVLAAGRGTRFGAAGTGGKVMADYGGRPLVVLATTLAMRAGMGTIIVVTGDAHEAIVGAIAAVDVGSADIRVLHNPDARSGMASSLRAAVRALPATCAAVIVLLADMPLVRPDTLARLIEAWEPGSIDAVVPLYDGRQGNPVLIDRNLFADLLTLTGDEGARRLFAAPGRRVASVVVDDPGVVTDVDTQDALRALPRPR